jgi:hypothetical protein
MSDLPKEVRGTVRVAASIAVVTQQRECNR